MLHQLTRRKERTAPGAPGSAAGEERPARVAEIPSERIRDLDVRPMLARGEEPFETIMAAARDVPAAGALRLRAPFEPVPLYPVMKDLGFDHWTERLAPHDWRVWFTPKVACGCGGAGHSDSPETGTSGDEGGATAPRERPPAAGPAAAQGPLLLDVRMLAGPEKHPTIHRMFDALAPGQCLTIVNDHNPKPLFYEMRAERPDRFDADNYRAYQASERVWVAVLPTRPAGG